ncbi:hypothetical protein BREVNS_1089 [Brevinematales bacterium NS]|jgi:hypothetical protein|nr:hypothetical protein [Brevinematales bacterium]QJR21839.1 hypothetical protein BREVNS_1089 [Brevinematales bacterium NS]
MERNLFAMEEWIYRASRRKHTPLPINFGIALLCEPLPEEQVVRSALQKMESLFPFGKTRVILREKERGILTTTDTSLLPVTFEEVPDIWDAVASQVGQLFDDPSLPLLRIKLYKSPQGGFFYAHFDHALVDGIGAISWLKTLFAILDGKDPSPLPTCDWDDVLAKHFTTTWQDKYISERSTKKNWWKSLQEILSEPSWPSHWHYRLLSHAFPPSTTRKLREKTQKEHTTVHAALAVSFLQAFYEKGCGHKRPQRTVLSPVNLRPLYGLSPDTFGLFNGTIRTTVDFSDSRPFWERCRFFKRLLDLQIKQTDFLYFHYRSEQDLKRALLHGFQRRRRFDTRKDYDLSLTNIGIVDGFPAFVKAIYGPIAQGLPTETVLGVCTYHDTMTLSWVSKPEFMPDDISRHLFQRGIEILLSVL